MNISTRRWNWAICATSAESLFSNHDESNKHCDILRGAGVQAVDGYEKKLRDNQNDPPQLEDLGCEGRVEQVRNDVTGLAAVEQRAYDQSIVARCCTSREITLAISFNDSLVRPFAGQQAKILRSPSWVN
jgi:hypothetical protein